MAGVDAARVPQARTAAADHHRLRHRRPHAMPVRRVRSVAACRGRHSSRSSSPATSCRACSHRASSTPRARCAQPREHAPSRTTVEAEHERRSWRLPSRRTASRRADDVGDAVDEVAVPSSKRRAASAVSPTTALRCIERKCPPRSTHLAVMDVVDHVRARRRCGRSTSITWPGRYTRSPGLQRAPSAAMRARSGAVAIEMQPVAAPGCAPGRRYCAATARPCCDRPRRRSRCSRACRSHGPSRNARRGT